MRGTRKRTGRPIKTAKPGTRVSLGLKVTADLKSLLDAAARKSGRTQSQEAELRLDRSFRDQALLHQVLELAFGKPLAAILLTLGRAMDLAGRTSAFGDTFTLEGADAWFDNAYGFDQAAQAAQRVLERLRPPGDPTPKARGTFGDPQVDARFNAFRKHGGAGWANSCLDALTGNTVTTEEEEWAAPLRDTLGPRIDRRSKTD